MIPCRILSTRVSFVRIWLPLLYLNGTEHMCEQFDFLFIVNDTYPWKLELLLEVYPGLLSPFIKSISIHLESAVLTWNLEHKNKARNRELTH